MEDPILASSPLKLGPRRNSVAAISIAGTAASGELRAAHARQYQPNGGLSSEISRLRSQRRAVEVVSGRSHSPTKSQVLPNSHAMATLRNMRMKQSVAKLVEQLNSTKDTQSEFITAKYSYLHSLPQQYQRYTSEMDVHRQRQNLLVSVKEELQRQRVLSAELEDMKLQQQLRAETEAVRQEHAAVRYTAELQAATSAAQRQVWGSHLTASIPEPAYMEPSPSKQESWHQPSAPLGYQHPSHAVSSQRQGGDLHHQHYYSPSGYHERSTHSSPPMSPPPAAPTPAAVQFPPHLAHLVSSLASDPGAGAQAPLIVMVPPPPPQQPTVMVYPGGQPLVPLMYGGPPGQQYPYSYPYHMAPPGMPPMGPGTMQYGPPPWQYSMPPWQYPGAPGAVPPQNYPTNAPNNNFGASAFSQPEFATATQVSGGGATQPQGGIAGSQDTLQQQIQKQIQELQLQLKQQQQQQQQEGTQAVVPPAAVVPPNWELQRPATAPVTSAAGTTPSLQGLPTSSTLEVSSLRPTLHLGGPEAASGQLPDSFHSKAPPELVLPGRDSATPAMPQTATASDPLPGTTASKSHAATSNMSDASVFSLVPTAARLLGSDSLAQSKQSSSSETDQPSAAEQSSVPADVSRSLTPAVSRSPTFSRPEKGTSGASSKVSLEGATDVGWGLPHVRTHLGSNNGSQEDSPESGADCSPIHGVGQKEMKSCSSSGAALLKDGSFHRAADPDSPPSPKMPFGQAPNQELEKAFPSNGPHQLPPFHLPLSSLSRDSEAGGSSAEEVSFRLRRISGAEDTATSKRISTRSNRPGEVDVEHIHGSSSSTGSSSKDAGGVGVSQGRGNKGGEHMQADAVGHVSFGSGLDDMRLGSVKEMVEEFQSNREPLEAEPEPGEVAAVIASPVAKALAAAAAADPDDFDLGSPIRVPSLTAIERDLPPRPSSARGERPRGPGGSWGSPLGSPQSPNRPSPLGSRLGPGPPAAADRQGQEQVDGFGSPGREESQPMVLSESGSVPEAAQMLSVDDDHESPKTQVLSLDHSAPPQMPLCHGLDSGGTGGQPQTLSLEHRDGEGEGSVQIMSLHNGSDADGSLGSNLDPNANVLTIHGSEEGSDNTNPHQHTTSTYSSDGSFGVDLPDESPSPLPPSKPPDLHVDGWALLSTDEVTDDMEQAASRLAKQASSSRPPLASLALIDLESPTPPGKTSLDHSMSMSSSGSPGPWKKGPSDGLNAMRLSARTSSNRSSMNLGQEGSSFLGQRMSMTGGTFLPSLRISGDNAFEQARTRASPEGASYGAPGGPARNTVSTSALDMSSSMEGVGLPRRLSSVRSSNIAGVGVTGAVNRAVNRVIEDSFEGSDDEEELNGLGGFPGLPQYPTSPGITSRRNAESGMSPGLAVHQISSRGLNTKRVSTSSTRKGGSFDDDF